LLETIMPGSDGESFAAGGAIGDALALGAGVSVADGVPIRYWKKLYWTVGEAGAFAGGAAGASEF
jgi:hypothetical protein